MSKNAPPGFVPIHDVLRALERAGVMSSHQHECVVASIRSSYWKPRREQEERVAIMLAGLHRRLPWWKRLLARKPEVVR